MVRSKKKEGLKKRVSGGGVSWIPGEVYIFLEVQERASLVAQWWKVCLPTQETWVQSMVQEDPTCSGATNPRHHNYWAACPRARALQQETPLQWETYAPRLERSPTSLNCRKAWAATKTQQSKNKHPEEQLKAPNSRGVPSELPWLIPQLLALLAYGQLWGWDGAGTLCLGFIWLQGSLLGGLAQWPEQWYKKNAQISTFGSLSRDACPGLTLKQRGQSQIQRNAFSQSPGTNWISSIHPSIH